MRARIRLVSSLVLFLIAFLASAPARAGEYETFDGRVYNGKFYPRIDILEWNEEGMANHMEFQNYNKEIQVEMAFQIEEKGGKKVMLVRYRIKRKEGEETLCRRVLAPSHFKENFLVYKDTADSDREITLVSMHPLPEKKGRALVQGPAKYASCELPDPAGRAPAAEEKKGEETQGKVQDKVPYNKGAILKKSQEVPYSDW